MIGSTVSHYKIIEKLGEGGMGVVYQAEDLKLKRLVALKFLPSHLSKTESDKARFLREATAAAALNHNNVCTIHEINDEGDNPFIVMEYVEGKTLKEIIQDCQKDPIPINTVIDYTAQIGEALKTAHAKGIVHRDIKAENIMITETGVVKVMDFGLAKLSGSVQLTKDTSTLGTVAYMSPEQIEGKEVDARADIFSFAVVLYEMLSCRMPFKGEYDSATMYAIINEEPDPIQKHRSDLSSEMLHVLNRALEKNPDERYQSVNDMLIDLKRIVKELSLDKTAHATVFSRAAKKPFWKKPIPISVIPLSSIMIVIVGYLLINQFILEERPEFELTVDVQWENSVAILLFDDLSPEQDQEWFAEGMAEQIKSALSGIQRLKVSALVIRYKNINKTLPEIAEELNVKNYVGGSIRKFEDSIKVTVNLINAETMVQIWAQDYDQERAGLFEMQDIVAQAVANELLGKLTSTEQLITSKRPDNTEAWESYMLGEYKKKQFIFANERIEDFYTSEKMYKNAIKLDANYAPAYVGLADLYLKHGMYNPKSEYESQIDKYIDMAFNLDPNIAELNTLMGERLWKEGKIDDAFELLKKAIELDPNCASCYDALAGYGLYIDLKYLNKAIELDPLDPTLYTRRAEYYFLNGQFDKAELEFQKAFDFNPDHSFTLALRLYYLISLKKYDEIQMIYPNKMNQEAGHFEFINAALYAISGDKEKALKNITDLTTYELVYIYSIMGMDEEIIKIVKKVNYYQWLKSNPMFDNIRTDTRFQDIMIQSKAKYDEYLIKIM